MATIDCPIIRKEPGDGGTASSIAHSIGLAYGSRSYCTPGEPTVLSSAGRLGGNYTMKFLNLSGTRVSRQPDEINMWISCRSPVVSRKMGGDAKHFIDPMMNHTVRFTDDNIGLT